MKSMNKNIKNILRETFVNEAEKPEADKSFNKISKENKKNNEKAVKDITSDVDSITPKKADELDNKFNYNSEEEKTYHEEMEIMNGQEMVAYDRQPNKQFQDRAIEAIEGSSRMGNNPEWANVVAKGQGGDPEFGKNLVKKIKSSQKKRSQQTPTTKMFGDDWEVVKDEGHKPYAISENQNKENQKNKEKMKRLKFKAPFNGVNNAVKLIPESYRVDSKVFEITDGNENYTIRWEGDINEGKAVILKASDSKLMNEDIQKMKYLMGYKSSDTLGNLKGKERLSESATFKSMMDKLRISESEDIEGQEADKEDNWEDADVNQAPEAKKHVEGSVSSEKGTQAPKPKEGDWSEAKKAQAPEAKKHQK